MGHHLSPWVLGRMKLIENAQSAKTFNNANNADMGFRSALRNDIQLFVIHGSGRPQNTGYTECILCVRITRKIEIHL